jgi:hypothetical protein
MKNPVLEDHSICGWLSVEHRQDYDVRHQCQMPAGHETSHECGCGKFWLNGWPRLKARRDEG